ncbi:MAG: sigma-70 family RNA polymerase sigma factor [Thermoleophilia bacterium]
MPQDAAARRERFERLHAAHIGVVTAWAFRRDTDRERARDLVAETFLVAWRRLDDVPPEAERAWLLSVASKIRRNQLRGEHRQSRMVERLGAHLPDPPLMSVPHELDPELAAALRELSHTDRELLLLIAWEQLSVAEAARVVGVTAVAARVRLHRLRRRLASLLETAAVPGPAAPAVPEEAE